MAQKAQKFVDGGDFLIPQFFGLHTAVKNPKDLALGQPQDSLNFITGYNIANKNADNIQLRTGSALLCKTRLGAGKINALAVGEDVNGTQWVFFCCGGQAYYYNPATGDLQTVTNGTLTATEDMTMEYYANLFGPYMYMGSQNTGINIISIANKSLAANLATLQIVQSGPFYGKVGGYITIRQNFLWLWNYVTNASKIVYKNDLNQSQPDQVAVSSSGITNPQGSTGVTGNGSLQTFSGTINGFANLAFLAQVGAPINTFAITSVVIANVGLGALDFQVNFTGGDVFAVGQNIVLQGTSQTLGGQTVNDFMGTVTAHSAGQVYLQFILPPASFTPTAGAIATFHISTIGSGYTLGDFVSAGGGSLFQVATLGSGNGIATVTMLKSGIGFSTGGQALSGGSGSSAVLSVDSVSNNQVPQTMTVSQVELFEDNQNGGLVSLLNPADTGTINYTTGAFTINTQTAIPSGLNIDSICFVGIPNILTMIYGTWTQHGGPIECPKFFNNQLYVFHTISTWLLNLGYTSNTSATTSQQQYRQNMGTSFFRAAYEKGDGILFLDDTDQNNPHFRELSITQFNNAVIPDSLSDDLDLSPYDFDNCVVGSVGILDFLACKSLVNDVPKSYNDTTFLRNNISGFWDKTDFRIGVMDVYNGAIVAGDTLSQNAMQLFTGSDDDGAPINAHWTSGQMNLGSLGLKQFGFFHIDGFIGPDQVCNIYAQWDAGNYVLIGSVYGNGKYVDQTNSISIGQGIGGTQPIGGAGNGQVTGYYFTQDIPIWTPLFQYVSIKFVPSMNLLTNKPAFGALQINAGWGFRDTRLKSVKAPAYTIGK